MKLIVILLLTIFLITNISALCSEGQIDINTASLEELDKLYGIGPVKAQAIIDTRPFDSVDELIDVYGIGNATLNGIKAQGLACAADEIDKEDNSDNSKENILNNTNTINDSNINNASPINNYQNQKLELQPIKLNYPENSTKDIKTEENSEFLDKNKDRIAMYGFFVFSVLIGILLIIRRKKIYKNDI